MAGFRPEKSLRVYGGGPARESHPVVYHPRSAAEPTGHLKLYSFTVLYYSAWVCQAVRKGQKQHYIEIQAVFRVDKLHALRYAFYNRISV